MTKSCLALLGAFFFISPVIAADSINVQIDRAQSKFNLGIAEFSPDDKKTDSGVVQMVESTVIGDLLFSKIFNLVENGPKVTRKNDAVEWAKLGSEMVAVATVRARPNLDVEVVAKLYDTQSAKEVLSISKKGPRADVRMVAHHVSNDIVKYFTGQAGIFTSKIVFANDATGRKELYVADYDGKNLKRLTNDNAIVILPRLSPDGKKIVYTSYLSGKPDLYLVQRDGSGRRKISSKAGLNVSPSWSPNNEDLAVTLSMDGSPNIYLMDTQGNVKQRLTDAPGADTAPSFAPDGAQFAFTSDRAGAPHIYISNLDGSGLRRITTASHCDSAAWSPDGQTILYVKGDGRGHFDIYSIEVLTGIERRLTWAEGDSENPAWSPDGRFILFTSNRRGKFNLYMMDADGSDQRIISTNNGQSFTPHWSNVLP